MFVRSINRLSYLGGFLSLAVCVMDNPNGHDGWSGQISDSEGVVTPVKPLSCEHVSSFRSHSTSLELLLWLELALLTRCSLLSDTLGAGSRRLCCPSPPDSPLPIINRPVIN
jgi:hypothetical protein